MLSFCFPLSRSMASLFFHSELVVLQNKLSWVFPPPTQLVGLCCAAAAIDSGWLQVSSRHSRRMSMTSSGRWSVRVTSCSTQASTSRSTPRSSQRDSTGPHSIINSRLLQNPQPRGPMSHPDTGDKRDMTLIPAPVRMGWRKAPESKIMCVIFPRPQNTQGSRYISYAFHILFR